jgi:prepilin peptidase CpaA
MTVFGYLLLMAFPALLVAAAVYDLMTMTIPNRLALAVALLFPVAALVAGLELMTFGWHLAAGLGVLCVCFGLFAMNWIGGGDAKLAAGIALWTGPFIPLLEWTILAGIFGGILTLALLFARRLPLPQVFARQPWIARLHDHRTGVPYGIALAAAGLAIYPSLAIFALKIHNSPLTIH